MNKNYTQDLKIVERFSFSNSNYHLNMFYKKIDSFITSKNKQKREKDKEYIMNSNNPIDPEKLIENPMKVLSNDLTKPIWNSITQVDPNIIYSINFNTSNSKVCFYNKLFAKFIERYKNEHEDQSNLKINLKRINSQQTINVFKYKNNTHQLFNKLKYIITRSNEKIQNMTQYEYKHYKSIIEIIDYYLKQNDPQFNHQLDLFIQVVVEALNEVLETKLGSAAICMQPMIKFLSVFIHPILIPLYNCLKTQQHQIRQRQEQKNQKKYIYVQPKIIEESKQKPYIFQQVNLHNISKVVFINLDGYQSEFNLDIVKSFSKYIMYVSFPKQSANPTQTNLSNFQQYNSLRFLRKFLYQNNNQQQKNPQIFQVPNKELKKNIYIFPIYSKSLSKQHSLPNIQFYQSSFVKFIMNQIIYNQIRQFNPSMIIISYSHKIRLQNEHYQDIIKQLTILANYKVVLFPNITKMYSFNEQISSQMPQSQKLMVQYRQYQQKYQNLINIINYNQNIDCDFFQKMSMFIKIASGTYNLDKPFEQDSLIQKFKNYQIMKYSASLIKIMSKQHSVLQKLKRRMQQYLNISKIYSIKFNNRSDTFQNFFNKKIKKYYLNLIDQVQKLLFEKNIQSEYQIILQKINNRYQQANKRQIWQNFKIQYCFQLINQKAQTKYYAYLPKYREKNIQNKQSDSLVSLQFQIQLIGQKIRVEFNTNTKFCYESQRTYKNALIYLLNLLPLKQSTQYSHYYGIVNELIDNKAQSKVKLFPIKFNSRSLKTFTTYTQFNYFQTQQYIFMFWPQIYDHKEQLISRIAHQTYKPKITHIIYRAERSSPQIFIQLPVKNKEQYQKIIPRHGCKCYQIQGKSMLYIFGGFYNNQSNFLSFQTDITVFTFNEFDAIIKNVDKSFYFNGEINQQGGYIINRINNDLIRPKVQYQIIQLNCNEQGTKEIFLLGGVGENFTRAYSMIGYMAHKIVFKDGIINSTKRIRMNNIVPINVKGPIKNRVSGQMNLIHNAQNRNIYTQYGYFPRSSHTRYHNYIYYNDIEDKFQYQIEYQYVEIQNNGQNKQTIKGKPQQSIEEIPLTTKSYQKKESYRNNIKLYNHANIKFKVQLAFQVSNEIKQKYSLVRDVVKVPDQSILAIDIYDCMLYAIIKHQVYTSNKCILVHYNINDLQTNGLHSQTVEINLKQIYKFDEDRTQNLIIAVNLFTIAILKDSRLNNIKIPQLILQKTKYNNYKKYQILQQSLMNQINENLMQDQMENQKNKISSSLYLNLNNGYILCFSFFTIKDNNSQLVRLVIEQLYMNSQHLYKWEKKLQTKYKFIVDQQQNKQSLQNFNLLDISAKHQNNHQNIGVHQLYKYSYILTAKKQQKIFISTINLNQSFVQFKPSSLTYSQYIKYTSNDSNSQRSIRLKSNSYIYAQIPIVC